MGLLTNKSTKEMNTPRQFLHNHPMIEFKLKSNMLTFDLHDHIVVDREDWEYFMQVPSLPVRFHRWMQKNDTEENAERFASYEDEDMYRAFLMEEILIQKEQP